MYTSACAYEMALRKYIKSEVSERRQILQYELQKSVVTIDKAQQCLIFNICNFILNIYLYVLAWAFQVSSISTKTPKYIIWEIRKALRE